MSLIQFKLIGGPDSVRFLVDKFERDWPEKIRRLVIKYQRLVKSNK